MTIPSIKIYFSLIIPDLLGALTDYNVRSVDEARRLMDLALTLGKDPWTGCYSSTTSTVLVRLVCDTVQRSLIEMSEQNSEILINVLKQTNGDLNDEIFGDQASLIDRIQTKSYKGSWLPGPDSGSYRQMTD